MAAELRARVANVLKTMRLPPSNITKEERKTLADLKKDQNIFILPSDKGRCTVVDKISYEAKVNNLLSDTFTYTKLKKDPNLLSDTFTYTKLKKDPTRKYQSDLVSILKTFKEEKVIDKSCFINCTPPLPRSQLSTGHRIYTRTTGHSNL